MSSRLIGLVLFFAVTVGEPLADAETNHQTYSSSTGTMRSCPGSSASQLYRGDCALQPHPPDGLVHISNYDIVHKPPEGEGGAGSRVFRVAVQGLVHGAGYKVLFKLSSAHTRAEELFEARWVSVAHGRQDALIEFSLLSHLLGLIFCSSRFLTPLWASEISTGAKTPTPPCLRE